MNNRNIVRRNQVKGLRQLQRTLDHFFNDAWWPSSELWTPSRLSEAGEEFQPQSRLSEDKNNYYVEMDLPGTKKEEVKIEVEENILRIHGERKEKKHSESSRQHYSEVFYGSFTREFTLPSVVKQEDIKARYEDGVLFITVPKTSKSKTHQINIE